MSGHNRRKWYSRALDSPFCDSEARYSHVNLAIGRATSFALNEAEDHAMNRSMTFGLSVLAGVALFEAALIPGVLIGGAAVLAPKYLPMLRRRWMQLSARGSNLPLPCQTGRTSSRHPPSLPGSGSNKP